MDYNNFKNEKNIKTNNINTEYLKIEELYNEYKKMKEENHFKKYEKEEVCKKNEDENNTANYGLNYYINEEEKIIEPIENIVLDDDDLNVLDEHNEINNNYNMNNKN